MHGAAAMFGKMNITFKRTTIASESVLCLQYQSYEVDEI